MNVSFLLVSICSYSTLNVRKSICMYARMAASGWCSRVFVFILFMWIDLVEMLELEHQKQKRRLNNEKWRMVHKNAIEVTAGHVLFMRIHVLAFCASFLLMRKKLAIKETKSFQLNVSFNIERLKTEKPNRMKRKMSSFVLLCMYRCIFELCSRPKCYSAKMRIKRQNKTTNSKNILRLGHKIHSRHDLRKESEEKESRATIKTTIYKNRFR